MEKPQYYNIELATTIKNNEEYIKIIREIYEISPEKLNKIKAEINMGTPTIIDCLPFDIAKTKTDAFIDACNKRKFNARLKLVESGIVAE